MYMHPHENIGDAAVLHFPVAPPSLPRRTPPSLKLVAFAGSGIPMQRGASLTTSEHIDPAAPPAQLADMEDPDSADIPEGAVRFNVTAEDIASAIAEESLEVRSTVAAHQLQDALWAPASISNMLYAYPAWVIHLSG